MASIIGRRAVLAGFATGLAFARRAQAQAPARRRVSVLFPGDTSDSGFMEAGLAGLRRASAELGLDVDWIDKVPVLRDDLVTALMRFAARRPDLIMAHGGQTNEAAATVAGLHSDLRFVVIQGDVTGPNLASYGVAQSESAWLAGAFAAMTTRSGVIGHVAGLRFPGALRARAAFAEGAAAMKSSVTLLTHFTGDQDDPAPARRVTQAMAEAGADIVFSMLNAARSGVTEICRAKGLKQIGNAVDWTKIDPAIFVASAVADSGLAIYAAALDLTKGRFESGRVVRMGLGYPGAVRLALGEGAADETRARLASLAVDIASGRRRIATDWRGEEFPALR